MNAAPLNEAVVIEALRQVIDPEIGCNIVDLGMIYDVVISGPFVGVTMTLTTPGCPVGEHIADGAKYALLALEGVSDAEVAITFEPPWHPDMMTEAGRAIAGTRY